MVRRQRAYAALDAAVLLDLLDTLAAVGLPYPMLALPQPRAPAAAPAPQQGGAPGAARAGPPEARRGADAGADGAAGGAAGGAVDPCGAGEQPAAAAGGGEASRAAWRIAWQQRGSATVLMGGLPARTRSSGRGLAGRQQPVRQATGAQEAAKPRNRPATRLQPPWSGCPGLGAARRRRRPAPQREAPRAKRAALQRRALGARRAALRRPSMARTHPPQAAWRGLGPPRLGVQMAARTSSQVVAAARWDSFTAFFFLLRGDDCRPVLCGASLLALAPYEQEASLALRQPQDMTKGYQGYKRVAVATGARVEALMRSAASAWGRRLEDVGAGARGRRRPLRERAQRSKQPQQGPADGGGCAPGPASQHAVGRDTSAWGSVVSNLAVVISSSCRWLLVKHREAPRCICHQARRRRTAVPSHPCTAWDM